MGTFFSIIFSIAFYCALFWVVIITYKWFSGRDQRLLRSIKDLGLEEHIHNFIQHFGLEQPDIFGWKFRNYMIGWDRINDLAIYLVEKGVPLRRGKTRDDTTKILRNYIQHKESNLTSASIETKSSSVARETTASLPYKKKEYLLTMNERKCYYALKQFAQQNNYQVFSKVRLEDIVSVPAQATDRLKYRGFIRSRHIDFVICDYQDIKPLIAIELDDASHNKFKSREVDQNKNEILEAAGLPLLRIRTQGFYDPVVLGQMIAEKLHG